MVHPARQEAAQAATLIRTDVTQRWLLPYHAARVSLSPRQFQWVFVVTFGVSPRVYVTILRT